MNRSLLVAGAALVLVAALGGCARPGGANTAAQVPGVSAAGAVAAAPGVPTTEIYVVPAAVKTEDGTLYRHTVGTPASADVLLARGTDATFVPAAGAGATSHVQWFSSTAGTVTSARSGTTTTEAVGGGSAPLTSLDLDGLHYAQVEDAVLATDASGAMVATYPLSIMKPDPTVGGLPAGFKGAYTGTGPGQVTALIPTDAGHVLAFRSSGLAAAVTDLQSGVSVPLPGYGTLGSAVRTASGQIVLLAWRGYQSTYQMRIVTLDGASLAVAAEVSTGLTTAGYLHDQALVGGGHQALVGISSGDEQSGVTLRVFGVDNGAITARPALPINAGLAITAAAGTSVYIYDGPAGNTVGQLDVATGAFTRDIPALRTPAGSFVVGLLDQ
jgi:hypothetical protein